MNDHVIARAAEVAESIRTKLARRRAVLGWSLQRVADAAGLTKAHVWELEQGRSTNPNVTTIVALADALGLSVEALMGLSRTSDYDPQLAQILADCRNPVIIDGRVVAYRDDDGNVGWAIR